MTSNKELIGASTRLLILSILAREANYGYAIIRAINKEAEGLFTWQEGTVYPILHKLEEGGLIRTRGGEAPGTSGMLLHHREGREDLAEGTKEWTGFHRLITALGEGSHG